VARLEVRDQGPGVPETFLKEIFQPFFRVSQARERRSGGSGVGLAITERAVRLHGGSVTARNADDGGLIVAIALPISVQTGCREIARTRHYRPGTQRGLITSVLACIRPNYLTHQCMESWSSPCEPLGPPPPLRRYILRAWPGLNLPASASTIQSMPIEWQSIRWPCAGNMVVW